MSDQQQVLQALYQALGSRLYLEADPEYDRRRSLFNAMIDRRPLAIAACASSADVAAVIKIATGHGIEVSVKGGGHGVSGNSVVDGAIMIDLEAMNQLDIDREQQVVHAGPGLRLGAFVTGCEAQGFVSPTGTVSDTGIAGLTLGAGFGYLNGAYGLAVDNFVSAELVTASGDIFEVNDVVHPDLMWALRGGGGNFGVVTRFDLRVYPFTQVLGGMLLYPWPLARDVLRLYRDMCASAPDELIMYAACLTGPDGNKAVGVIACWCGDLTRGEEVLAPIRTFGPPILDLVEPCPYSRMNTLVDAAVPPGLRFYWKQSMFAAVPDEMIDVLVDRYETVPSPRSVLLLDHVNGVATRRSADATAFPHRDVRHSLLMLSTWTDPEVDEVNRLWTRQLAVDLERFATGGIYTNEAWDEKSSAAYGLNFARLQQIKTKVDPSNVFRHNTNIPPVTM